ncbi:MAG: DUF6538 domain-containing protein [Thiotrichales bacterium]
MRNQTHLFKRAGVYYSRVRIPRDLVEPLGGRQEIRLSLRTKERPEAVRSESSYFASRNPVERRHPVDLAHAQAVAV